MNGACYIASFPVNLLGSDSDVEVSVALDSREATTLLSMRRILSPDPAFSISLKDLEQFASGILAIKNAASLLDELPGKSDRHQLKCRAGGAEAVVTLMARRSAHLSVSIGRFHWHGDLSMFSMVDLNEAIAETKKIEKLAQDKVRSMSKSTGKNVPNVPDVRMATPAP